MVFTSTVSPSLQIGLRFLGVWCDVSYTVLNGLVYLLSLLIIQCFQYLYTYAHCTTGELQNLVDSLPATINNSLTIVKLMTLWKNRRVVRELLDAMDTDWRECASIEQHLHLMATKAGVSHFCSNALFGFNTFAGALYFMADTAIAIVHQAGGDNDTSRPLPVKILLPFEVDHSPIYELLVVFLFTQSILNVYTVSFVNVLLLTLILHASGQIDIIREELITISEEMPYYGSSGHTLGILVLFKALAELEKRIMSCLPTYYDITQRIITIDPWSLKNGRKHVGMRSRDWTMLSQFIVHESTMRAVTLVSLHFLGIVNR
ncbi:PREDICTED: uncharacterized protein LOC106747953 [Dinoponera quadriceps]|uniref:Uncharacterized protein LOC106747953 n=1 Tax=Dinoponera quadriceps TaxID=609295 RepID=A0A6P3XSK7_DINQU|nr:PREDICTED: uncharacterized protein LOC106747953 [Dinoponera quadriceps]